jgi:hypothetical protein
MTEQIVYWVLVFALMAGWFSKEIFARSITYLPPVSEFPLFYLAVHVPMPYMAQAPPWPKSAGAG